MAPKVPLVPLASSSAIKKRGVRKASPRARANQPARIRLIVGERSRLAEVEAQGTRPRRIRLIVGERSRLAEMDWWFGRERPAAEREGLAAEAERRKRAVERARLAAEIGNLAAEIGKAMKGEVKEEVKKEEEEEAKIEPKEEEMEVKVEREVEVEVGDDTTASSVVTREHMANLTGVLGGDLLVMDVVQALQYI